VKQGPGALITFDLIFLVLLLMVVGVPCAALVLLLGLLAQTLPVWLLALACPVWAVLFLALMTGMAALINMALPVLEPGSYPFPGHAQSRAWLMHFALQRVLHLPLWRHLFFCFATLRTAMLRALGARVAFCINTSSNATVLDAPMMHIGERVMLASQVLLSGHFVEGERLRLGRVELAEGVQVLEGVKIAPDVTVGEYTMIGPETRVADSVTIGEYAHIGAGCTLGSRSSVGDNAVLGHRVILDGDVSIGEGAVVQSGAHLPQGASVGEGERFPPRVSDNGEGGEAV